MTPDNAPDRQELPASWAESHRFVPRAFVQPALSFMRLEASGGILMLLAAVLAIVLANGPWADGYFGFFDTRIEIAFGDFHFQHLSELTVREWVNDALMVLFFFVVGLEIKRELVVGELQDPRAAALPAVAAIGGMAVPALLYVLFNTTLFEDGAPSGWGIPMATDIAFAVGVISLLGRRVPIQAKLFLLALAIVDDLGAILVIAIFYTAELSFAWLAVGAAGLALMAGMRRMDVRSVPAYVAVGVMVWLAILESGVHATVAGVATALITPTRSFYRPELFGDRAQRLVERVDAYVPESGHLHELDHNTLERVQALMRNLLKLTRESLPPLERLEYSLARWTSFLVVPVFAFANAGVRLSGDVIGGAMSDPVLLGVFAGLLVGKIVGVTGAAWLAVKLGIGRLPHMTTWRHMTGMGFLAGIGFTVALFVAALSFPAGSGQLDSAKIGIFAASLLAGVGGYLWLRFVAPSPEELDPDRDGVPGERAAATH